MPGPSPCSARATSQNALPIIDSLTAELPENPYFWELKGQALLENGRAAEAVAPLQKALKLLPNNGLIQILMAQALIDTEKPANAKQAIKLLKQAQRSEGETPVTYKYLARAYALTGRHPARRTGHRRGRPAAGRQEAGDGEGEVGPEPLQDGHAGMDPRQRCFDFRRP